ncbi:MAG: enoyl-CoA hydratase/isomerase family protein, partial [Rhizobiales bacterium]|nr:enoyl-CoA hydratase/isomerase family protein [Hyphomicrobiales bacterium]
IRALYEQGRAGKPDRILQFWREEYVLNTLIKRFPKPYIALIDGIVMGGGVGVSVHGSHRIAGERYQFAMPEVGIGFFPDVGATWFLPRLPGQVGAYCALTGERLKAADGLATGLATHYVRSARWAEMVERLTREPVDEVLAGLAEQPASGALATKQAAIDLLFEGARVEGILRNLDREAESRGPDAGFAGATAAVIRSKSPTSLKIALAQVRRGGALSFTACMRTEFRIVSRIVYGHDFYEGVRAAIIDKDQAPRWRPATLADVADAEVERYFAPLENGELDLP